VERFLTVFLTVSVFSQCMRVSMWWVHISPDYEIKVLLSRKKEIVPTCLIFWVVALLTHTHIHLSYTVCLFLLRSKTPTFRIQTVKKASRIFWGVSDQITTSCRLFTS